MNKDNAKDYLPLVQALAEGKVIQHRSHISGKWGDVVRTNFPDEPDCYRIKPEPRRAWVWWPPAGSISCVRIYTSAQAVMRRRCAMDKSIEAAARALAEYVEGDDEDWQLFRDDVKPIIAAYRDAEIERLKNENVELKRSVNRWRSDVREFQDAYTRLRAEFDAPMEDKK